MNSIKYIPPACKFPTKRKSNYFYAVAYMFSSNEYKMIPYKSNINCI